MSINQAPASFYDQEAFIFMPFATEVEVEPLFSFKWGIRGVACTFDPTTRVLTAEGDDAEVESDPRLHSWLQSIFG